MEPGSASRLIKSAGQDDFLDAVYRRHRQELCGYVRRKFGAGPPEPEDIAQAAFARFAALENRAEIPNPKAYLMLTARNLVIDARRHDSTSRNSLQQLEIIEENRRDPSAEDVYASKEELQRLAVIVAELKPKQRAAFLLSRIDGLSYVEIAERMNISQSGARLLVEKALEICVAKMRRRP